MIGPPPITLTERELDRLELVDLPAEGGEESSAVYRFADTGEFVVEDEDQADEIRAAYPSAQIRRV